MNGTTLCYRTALTDMFLFWIDIPVVIGNALYLFGNFVVSVIQTIRM